MKKIKTYNNFINESIKDKMVGKSKDEIRNRFEKMGNWERGIYNTKQFKINTPYGKEYVPGCFLCNKIVELEHTRYRQLLGNVYQTLCTCKECGEYVILDENKSNLLDAYLNDELGRYKLYTESLRDKMKGKNKDDVIKSLLNTNLKPSTLLNKSIDNNIEEGIILALSISEYDDDWFELYVDKALIWAVDNNKPHIIKLYIDQGFDVKIIDNKALRTASYEGYYDIVKLLLEAGADVHSDNDASIKWASANGHHKIVKLLLDYHANPSVGLKYAKRNGYHNIVRLLNQYIKKYPHRAVNESIKDKMKGINQEDLDRKLNNMSPFRIYYTSIRYHYTKGAKMGIELLEKTGELKQDSLDAMLNSAVMYNNLEITKILIEKGADVNGKGNYDILYHAVDYENIDMVKLLLDKGNFEQTDLDVALFNAMNLNNINITELLLKKGAKPNEEDYQDILENGYKEIYRLLKKYENKNVNESLKDKMKGKSSDEIVNALSNALDKQNNYLSDHIKYFHDMYNKEQDEDMKEFYKSYLDSFNNIAKVIDSNPDRLIIIDNENDIYYEQFDDFFHRMGFYNVDKKTILDNEFNYTVFNDNKIIHGSAFDYDAPNVLIFDKDFIIDKIKNISNEKN